mmetsp:Transcript_9448/g.18412  ORF Transcript_9448/g.18412 Transcript_9448/m.18412 type:complete len:84 (-) Transcript_9448:12-263(-)
MLQHIAAVAKAETTTATEVTKTLFLLSDIVFVNVMVNYMSTISAAQILRFNGACADDIIFKFCLIDTLPPFLTFFLPFGSCWL